MENNGANRVVEYLNRSDLANYLKCGRTKIQELRRARLLPAPVLVGGTPLWIRQEVDEYLSTHCRADH